MKDNIRMMVTFGFMALLALILSLSAISLKQLHAINESMGTLIRVTHDNTYTINNMRDAMRLVTESLQSMQLKDVIVERNEEHQRFISHATKFRSAWENLVTPGVNEAESVIHAQLRELITSSDSAINNASAMLLNNASRKDIEPALEKSARLQQLILAKLNELAKFEQQQLQKTLIESSNHYKSTRNLLFILAGIALLFSILVARMVIRHVSDKNRLLNYQASHDTLTGLINRREFEHRVERSIARARTQATTHALLYLDLDQFKIVNDTCGHAAGDELLQQLAQLLLSSVRHRDTLSRLGGDEFGMLLENCPLDKAVEIANDLLTAINNFQFTSNDNTFILGISIGIVPIDHSTTDFASTMSAADSACYIAKDAGRHQVQIAHMGDRRLQERHGEMQWVARLNKAIANDQFALYFQPVIPCASKPSTGRHLEILVRLLDDDGTIITPVTFLPAAEKYNLLTNIDRWVIEHSLRWLAKETSTSEPLITLSINISGQTIGNPEMLKFILDMREESGVSASQVIFEVTETAAIANITTATSFMLALRGCGFRFTLDDFGSGLSSFTYLKKLPVDYLKIDGIFVRDILSDPVDYAMVKAISELGQLLGKKIIAELVETDELAEALRKLGVDYMQGHSYGKPQPLNNFIHSQVPRLVVVSS